jgi:murein DD-endopeptidase MepM/ murein hydrolase activator NlpD
MKKHQLGNRRCTSLVSLLALLLIAVLPASAAYQMQRPITYDGGRLNQSYLYGEEWDTSTHKGVDFSYDLDTHVYATADGTVVDLYEDYDDGDDRDPLGWGNRVLIRHSARHWDRTTQQWAYVIPSMLT